MPIKMLDRIRNFFQIDEYISTDRKTHIIYLIILSVILFLPFFLTFSGNVDSGMRLFGWKLPSTCMSKELFGTKCPGCGLTRAFVLLTHGFFKEAHHFHRLALVLYIFFLMQFIYRIYALCALGKKNPAFLVKLQFYIPLSVILLLIINWLLELCICGKCA